MSKFFLPVGLAFVIAALAFMQTANATRNHHRHSAPRQTSPEREGTKCMYRGYPCDDWKRLDG
jgi:hypothetical protein